MILSKRFPGRIWLFSPLLLDKTQEILTLRLALCDLPVVNAEHLDGPLGAVICNLEAPHILHQLLVFFVSLIHI